MSDKLNVLTMAGLMDPGMRTESPSIPRPMILPPYLDQLYVKAMRGDADAARGYAHSRQWGRRASYWPAIEATT